MTPIPKLNENWKQIYMVNVTFRTVLNHNDCWLPLSLMLSLGKKLAYSSTTAGCPLPPTNAVLPLWTSLPLPCLLALLCPFVPPSSWTSAVYFMGLVVRVSVSYLTLAFYQNKKYRCASHTYVQVALALHGPDPLRCTPACSSSLLPKIPWDSQEGWQGKLPRRPLTLH